MWIVLPLHHTINLKVSVNRLFARPLWTRQNPAAMSILRGESIDCVIVRKNDSKIIAAIDIKRQLPSIDGLKEAKEAKKVMLENAGIPYFLLDCELGQQGLKEALRHVLPRDVVEISNNGKRNS
jgi:nicotinamide riboside kinase